MPPISDTQLTDLPTLKAWMGINASDTASDAALTRLITVVSEVFKRRVNRPKFIEATFTEVVRGNNSDRLILKNQPVTSVTSITENGKLLQPSSTWYQGGYSFDKYGVIGNFYGFANIEYTVVYTGGFALNSPEAYMAEQAVISAIYLWWKRRPHTDQDKQSLGQQVTASFIQVEFPPETMAIINSLIRVV